jgi:prepilin-type N-terminal cleavage/methylation domain-containing protein
MFRRTEGFSLIELIVAVAIMAIVVSQLMLVFTTQRRAMIVNDRVLDVQESARTVIDLVSFDARMAGFMVPRVTAISSFDGGATGSDRICISDSSYFSTPLDGTKSPALDNRDAHFSRATLTGLGAGSITVESLDIDEDGATNDFAIGAGVVVSDGAKTHCAAIETFLGNTVDFDDAHSIPTGLFSGPAGVFAVPAIIYELDEPSLTLTRNGVTLSTSIEDLQIEYWVDSQVEDGVIGGSEWPIHDLNTNAAGFTIDTQRIRRVRISAVSRTDSGDGQAEENFQRFFRPANANRNAGAMDEFRRRRFTASVAPRNMF